MGRGTAVVLSHSIVLKVEVEGTSRRWSDVECCVSVQKGSRAWTTATAGRSSSGEVTAFTSIMWHSIVSKGQLAFEVPMVCRGL